MSGTVRAVRMGAVVVRRPEADSRWRIERDARVARALKEQKRAERAERVEERRELHRPVSVTRALAEMEG